MIRWINNTWRNWATPRRTGQEAKASTPSFISCPTLLFMELATAKLVTTALFWSQLWMLTNKKWVEKKPDHFPNPCCHSPLSGYIYIYPNLPWWLCLLYFLIHNISWADRADACKVEQLSLILLSIACISSVSCSRWIRANRWYIYGMQHLF